MTNEENLSTESSEAADAGTSDASVSEADQTVTSGDNTEDGASATTEGTQEEEWLLPGRFKRDDVGKLVDSYRNLESYASRVAAENAEFKRNQQRVEEPTRNPEKELDEFAAALKSRGPDAIRDLVRSDIERIESEMLKSRIVKEYEHRLEHDEEFRQLEPRMTALATEYKPFLEKSGLARDPKVFDVLLALARGTDTGLVKKAESQGRKKGEIEAKRKIKAQVEGSSGTRGVKTKDPREMSREELKAFILKQSSSS